MPFLKHFKGYFGAKRRENFRVLMPLLNDSECISARSADNALAILGPVNPRKVSVAPRPIGQTLSEGQQFGTKRRENLAIWKCLLTREMPFLNHSKGHFGAKRRENFRVLMPFLNDSEGISARSAEKILAILGPSLLFLL